jgi:hypothetical protein
VRELKVREMERKRERGVFVWKRENEWKKRQKVFKELLNLKS